MIQIIACGNNLRRDDGAGLVLAELLEKEWRSRQIEVERISVHQLTPELAADIARAEVTAVVFVDTRVVTRDEPDEGLQARPIAVDTASPSMGHHLDPATLLAYARLLYDKHLPAWQITVPGFDFGHGEGLSTSVVEELAGPISLQKFTEFCLHSHRPLHYISS